MTWQRSAPINRNEGCPKEALSERLARTPHLSDVGGRIVWSATNRRPASITIVLILAASGILRATPRVSQLGKTLFL